MEDVDRAAHTAYTEHAAHTAHSVGDAPRRRRGMSTLAATAVVAVALLTAAFAGWSPAPAASPRPAAASGSGGAADPVVRLPAFGSNSFQAPTETQNATVENQSSAPIHIGAVTLIADGFPITLVAPDTCSNTVLQPRQFCVVGMRYTVDQSSRSLPFTLRVPTDTNPGFSVSSYYAGSFYGLSASPSPVGFGSPAVSTASDPQTTTVTDYGSSSYWYAQLLKATIVGPAAGDYHFAPRGDGCSGMTLNVTSTSQGAVAQTCSMTVVFTPSAVGDRPAFIDVPYCTNTNTTIGAVPGGGRTAASGFPAQDCVTPYPNPVAGYHLLIPLNGAGSAPPATTPTTPAATPTTPATTPPTTVPAVFAPTLTTSPLAVPAGRVTLVSGTGFPKNAAGAIGMLSHGAPALPTVAALLATPQAAAVKTDASGAFAGIPLVVMPHTPAGTYPLEAIVDGPDGPVALTIGFLVVPGTEQPPKFVNRH